jgi:hypothetical protein
MRYTMQARRARPPGRVKQRPFIRRTAWPDLPIKTDRTEPEDFRQDQNTFAGPRTLLTANFSFGVSKTPPAPPKLRRKPQNSAGTVPALFAPL